jgi:hypothetical protein
MVHGTDINVSGVFAAKVPWGSILASRLSIPLGSVSVRKAQKAVGYLEASGMRQK